MIALPRKAVVIGASAGGVEALSAILPHLPPDHCPVLVVIHLPSNRHSLLADLFSDKCRMKVVEAEDKAPIDAGTIYFAPPDYHLMIEPDFTVALSNEAPVWFSRPSIDVLFETAADAYGPGLTGVILTGANEDGAGGLRTVMAQEGRGLIQSPETAYARLMPETAMSLCPKALVRPLDQLADELLTEAA